MSQLISQLPEPIKQRALECQRECNSTIHSKETDELDFAFDWCKTTEGSRYWYDVWLTEYQTTAHTNITQRIADAQDYQQLLEVSHYVEREYKGDKTELRKLIDAKFKPDLDDYPLGK